LPLKDKSVLFAWELGEGLGHLPPLKAIARALQQEGVKVAFALREPETARAALAELGAQIVQAPFWPTPAPPSSPSGSYADILAGNGYGTATDILKMIVAWDGVIDAVRPDLIVCDHAPGAALSAFGRIPVAFVGNGFAVPPCDGAIFPPFETDKSDAARQVPVQAALQEALAALRRQSPRSICEPFRGVFRGVYSFALFDTYRDVRPEAVLGPIEPLPALTPLPASRRMFAYSASNNPAVNELTQALMDFGSEAAVYFRGAPGARSAVLRSRGVRVYDTAPALVSVLPECGAVFSHGGPGFAHAALAAGRPHIVSPRHFEALVTGRRIEELGAGIVVHPFEPKLFREAMRRAFDDAAVRAAAQTAGAAAQAFMKSATPLATTMEALRRVLG
jgi:UDP:flavonoid glycosyltransferase YjiC (YdhE family)